MKAKTTIALVALSLGVFAQSFTITTPDSQQFKMEMEGFEDPTQTQEQPRETSSQVKVEWAKVAGNQIILPDGRTLSFEYSPISGMVGCEIEMKEPAGARVELSYDDKVVYTSEAPFFYREKAFQYFSSYFKLVVTEPSGTAWAVKLQNKKNQKITISTTVNTSSPTPTPEPSQPTVVTSDGDCGVEMASSDFNRALESIKSKSFEDTKLDLAKQITRANCLSSEQIMTVMKTFTFEDTRLEYAMFAYKYCIDPNQYYIVNDAFEFELTIEELQEYIDDQN